MARGLNIYCKPIVMKSTAIRTSKAHRANIEQGRKKFILFCLFVGLVIFAVL
jgi:hypothetical protein